MKYTLTARELSNFFGQLGMLIHLGISVTEGLAILQDESQTDTDREIITALLTSMEETGSLTQAMETSGRFPHSSVSYIKTGEETGCLDEILNSLTLHYEQEQEVSEQIRSAVTYPLIMLGMMGIVIVVLLVKVLPVFQQIYGELGSQLTGVAGAFMRFSMVLNRYMLVIVLLLAIAVVALVFFFKSNHGKRFLQKKTYAMALATGRFANCMSLAMSSGLDTDQGLLFAEQLVDNPYMAKRIRTCSDLIASGKSFAEAILSTHIFDRVYVSMISIGFRTGTLDEVMAKISEEYEDAIENRIAKFIAILEPTLVIILSVVIGSVLISFLLPLIGIMSSIG